MDREHEIRERARQIWEDEGRPEGMHDSHWRRAEEEIEATEPNTSGEFTENWREEAGLQNEESSPPVMPTVIPPD